MLHFERWKIALISLVCLTGVLATLPNFLNTDADWWPSFFPDRQIVLGLDLQGGAYLLYQVDETDYKSKRLANLVGEIRSALRQEPRIGYTNLGRADDGVQLRIRDVADLEAARTRLTELVNPLVNNLLSGATINEFSLNIASDGLVRFDFTDDGFNQRIRQLVEQSIEVIRRRIDELGTTEPNIQREGTNRILVEAPGEQDSQRLKDLIGKTAQMTFHMVDESVSPQAALDAPRLPAGTIILYDAQDPTLPYLVREEAPLSGEDLIDAQTAFDQSNQPVVTFRFNTSGARTFGRLTQANVDRRFAVVLDNEVLTAPVIREPIVGGSGQISGGFSVDSANDLAIQLRAGALPAELIVVEERTVGPGLGQDSIDAGSLAAVIGSIAVVAFMVLAYGRFGIYANIALVLNVCLILGVMSLLQATLTLPGIAGIVLTVGMAVDANVLIFERIREEARSGRSAILAMDAGFKRAFGTILDANVTTLIAAVILFQLGSGPIRGFAVTLAIGILTSVFSAYLVTRLLVALWVRRTRPQKVPI